MKLVYKEYEANINKELRDIVGEDNASVLMDLVCQLDNTGCIVRTEGVDENGNPVTKYKIRFYKIEE